MEQIQETMESYSDVEYLKDNKDELVETIAVESDLDLEENRKMIERTVENMYLEEKFSRKESSTELEPSPIEDVKSTLFHPTPSQGVAKVTNIVEVRDGVLELTFSVRDIEDEFTKKFYHNNYGDTNLNVESRKDLERLYKLAGTDISNPTDIIGNTVPVKPGRFGYTINYPPSDPGIGRRIAHHSLRKLRKYDLIGYNSDNIEELRTKINNRFYIILSLFTVPFLIMPFNILTVSIFFVIFTVWIIVLFYQLLYSVESRIW